MAELNKSKARQLTLYGFHVVGEVIFEAEKYGHFGEFLPHAYFHVYKQNRMVACLVVKEHSFSDIKNSFLLKLYAWITESYPSIVDHFLDFIDTICVNLESFSLFLFAFASVLLFFLFSCKITLVFSVTSL